MVNENVRKFLEIDLKLDDQEVIEYIEFLLKNHRVAEIEPYLETEQYRSLLKVWENETKFNLILDTSEPSFLQSEIDEKAIHKEAEPLSASDLKLSENDQYKYKIDPNLPIGDYEQEIITKIRDNRVLLIEGSTGCGKSTQVPYFMLNFFEKIVVSQPRRLAASNLARRVANESNTSLGDLVGYKVRFDEKISSTTRLKFVTDGVLLLDDKDYDLIIIDEVHERKINTDVFFALLNKYKYRRLILMSATIQKKEFVKFFNCEHILIRQKQFETSIRYFNSSEFDYCEQICELIGDMIKNVDKPLNILVFLTGLQDINICYDILSQLKFEAEILKLHGSMEFKEQQLVFQSYSKSKIILSTNLAETSITIEDLDIVVDSGFVKQKIWTSGIEELKTVRISKQQAKQRAGRVGRTKKGVVFRIYSEEEYSKFLDQTPPEIEKANLSTLIIQLKKYGHQNIFDYRFLNWPPLDNLKSCMKRLFLLNVLDNAGKLTTIGRKISKLPLEPELAISLLKAQDLDVLIEVSIICAIFSVPNFFNTKNQAKLQDFRQKCHFIEDDFTFLLYLYTKQDYTLTSKKGRIEVERIYRQIISCFCSEDFNKKDLKYKRLRHTESDTVETCKSIKCEYLHSGHAQKHAHKNSKQFLKTPESVPKFDKTLFNSIKTSFCAGFFLNTAFKAEECYKLFMNGNSVYIHPTSILNQKQPRFILFHSIFVTSKQFVKVCMPLDQHDLKNSSLKFKITRN